MIAIRTINWTTLAVSMFMSLPAVAQDLQQAAPKPAAAEEARTLNDDKQKTSYAVGMNLGSAIRRQSADRSAELDVNLIVRGFKDGFAGGETLLTQAEMRIILKRLQGQLKSREAAERSEKASWAGSEGEAILAGINISFKLDPRLTKGLYLGERWVSGPYAQVGAEKARVTVEARAEGVDRAGRSMQIRPEWKPIDPGFVRVTPARENEVKITAVRPGEGRLQVTFGGISRELAIKAAYKGEALQMEISPATTPTVPRESVERLRRSF